MTISVLHAAYGRPQISKQCREIWLDRSVFRSRIEWLFAFESGLPECHAVLDAFGPILTHPQRIHVGGTAVLNWNAAAAAATGDVLVVSADDLHPPQDWDWMIWKELRHGEEAVLRVRDGHRHWTLMRHPILTRRRYNRFGYIFHPDYDGVMADVEFTRVAVRDGVVREAPHIVFDHRHPSRGLGAQKDAQHRVMNSSAAMRYGNQVLERRSRDDFPANDEMKLQN